MREHETQEIEAAIRKECEEAEAHNYPIVEKPEAAQLGQTALSADEIVEFSRDLHTDPGKVFGRLGDPEE